MKGVVYIHVPKCGGSSVSAALRLRYALSHAAIPLDPPPGPLRRGEDRLLATYARRDAVLAAHLRDGTRCILGHVRYRAGIHDGPGRHHAFVTLLRDPVERFVSHYNYLQRRHPDPERAPTLEAFLDTPQAARLAAQYLFYFGAESQAVPDDPAPGIARAQAALKRFALVGDLSDLPSFARDLARLTGVPALPMIPRNRAPERTQVPEALRPRIETLCAADLAIWRAVRDRSAAA